MVAFLGLILILVAILRFSDDTPFPNYQALLPTLGTVLILLFARSENLAVKIIGNRVFVGIGLISYSLYLVHQPIFAFMRIRMFDDPNIYQYQIGICVAFGLAFLSYKFIEKPIRQNAWGVQTFQKFTCCNHHCRWDFFIRSISYYQTRNKVG